jgi:hypothetical protein
MVAREPVNVMEQLAGAFGNFMMPPERNRRLYVVKTLERQEHKDPVDVLGCRRGLCVQSEIV